MAYRRLAKDTLIYGSADLIGKIISFLVFPIIANVFSPANFGALEVILVTSNLIGLFIGCGISNGLHRYFWEVSNTNNQRNKLISSGLYIIVLLSVIFSITSFLLFFLGHLLNVKIPYNLTFLGVIYFTGFTITYQINTFFLDVLRINFEAIKFFIISTFFRAGLAIFSVFFVLFVSKDVEGYLASQFYVSLIVFFITSYLLRKYYSLDFDGQWVQKLFRFGYPFIFMGVGYWIFTSTDRWMLAYFSTLEEVGIYSVAFRFVTIISFISIAFGAAWGPWAFKIKKEHEFHYPNIYGNIFLIFFFVMIFLGSTLILFSDELIGFLMSKRYINSSDVLKVLVIGAVLQSTQQISAIGIPLEGKTNIFNKFAWVTAGLNVILNYIFIPLWGALGAALATIICHFCLTFFYFIKTYRYGHIKIDFVRLIVMLASLLTSFIITMIFFKKEITKVMFVYKILVFFTLNLVCYLILPVKGINFINEKFLKV